MTPKRYSLYDVLNETRAEVEQWPEWKRSDDVRRALRELEERKRAPQTASRPSSDTKGENR